MSIGKAFDRARRKSIQQISGGPDPQKVPRVIKLNLQKNVVEQSPQQQDYADNEIQTSHYTWWNFIFLNIYKQFHRAANIYFFVIMILQTWMEVSITQGNPSMAMPLVFVLMVTAIKDALEDFSRHRYDRIENNRSVEVFDRVENEKMVFVEKTWSSLRPGSVVKIKNRERIPADIVLLSCSDSVNRVVYVMTAGLDGETNLKQRVVALGLPDDLAAFDENGSITCDPPNKILDGFDATCTYAIKGNTIKVPLSTANIALRGSVLRNSTWAIGVVVYAGEETKLQMNAAATSFKTSSCMTYAQQMMIYVFLMQCLFCVLASIVSAVMSQDTYDYFYLVGRENHALYDFILRFFNYVIIFTNFIPISLLVTIDMVKFGQGFFISLDLSMYHEESDRMTKVNCSELNEELGCIEHIFSDKTGTLTANVMKFKAAVVNGQILRVTEGAPNGVTGKPSSSQIIANDKDTQATLERYFESLALNHEVIPEIGDNGQVVFSASSPDEGALVQAAKDNGFSLVKRMRQSLFIQIKQPPGVTPRIDTKEYMVHHILPFTSDRKRSSVIVEDPDTGALILHCKGADNVIISRLKESSLKNPMTQQAMAHLDELATSGLRTLCVASRVIDPEFFDAWNIEYNQALVSVENRAALIAAVQEKIESDLDFIGCTAIEDKLQEEVPETIAFIREAGIKVWMLTGDKVDTAVNIGLSCALWTHQMKLIYLIMDDVAYSDMSIAILDERFSKVRQEMDSEAEKRSFCLVVDTKAVHAISTFKQMPAFLQLANRCNSVICARVSPDQKAVIVQGVRESDPQVKTLSIGDGANDVPMIQKAHVGIGIYGQEGLQAANAADFAIARFRFLKNLLFVHGRWSERRVGILVSYMFYKNAILVLPQFFYAFVCLASGQNFYLDYPLYQGYNLIFTSFPILFLGMFDQDVSAESALANPRIYKDGSLRSGQGSFISHHIFWKWIFEGFYQSVILVAVLLGSISYASGGIINSLGHASNIWYLGTVVNLCVCIVVTIRLLAENKTVNIIMVVSYLGSFLLWFFFLYIWSETTTVPDLFASKATNAQSRGIWHILYQPLTWYATLLATVMAVVPTLATESYSALFKPRESDIVREKELIKRRSAKAAKAGPTVHPAEA